MLGCALTDFVYLIIRLTVTTKVGLVEKWAKQINLCGYVLSVLKLIRTTNIALFAFRSISTKVTQTARSGFSARAAISGNILIVRSSMVMLSSANFYSKKAGSISVPRAEVKRVSMLVPKNRLKTVNVTIPPKKMTKLPLSLTRELRTKILKKCFPVLPQTLRSHPHQ